MDKIRLPFLIMIFCLALAACSPSALIPVLPTSTANPEGPKGLEVRPAFLDHLAKLLAHDHDIPVDQVILKEYRAVEWPDACLGLTQPGEVCAQTITPGYLVIFSTPKGAIELHTNGTGDVYRQSASISQADERPVLVTWQRSGGFAGICNRLMQYADGGYLLQDCVKSTVISQGQLPSEALTHLKEWTGKYSSFHWKSVPPAGTADMFTDELTFNGQGSQNATEQQRQDIFSYLAQLTSQLKK